MTLSMNIFTYISRIKVAAFALILTLTLACNVQVKAQKYVPTEAAKQKAAMEEVKKEQAKSGNVEKIEYKEKKPNFFQRFAADSTAWVNGVQINVDIVGPIASALSEKKWFEAAAKVSLKDIFYPTLELGYAFTDYDEPTSSIKYKTGGIYGRIGFDYNILKDKHDIYKFFLGARFAGTFFNYDLSSPDVTDPIYGGEVEFRKDNVKCSYLWMELLAGVDAKILGPVHLGWTMRYKRKLSGSYDGLNKAWYVPGYGNDDSAGFGATFTIGIDIFDLKKK